MIEVKAPNPHPTDRYTIFLGGAIDQGSAVNWQAQVVEALKDVDNLLILNPRRDAWDPSWVQSIDNPEFVEQVEWELDGQSAADLNLYVFAPDEESAKTIKAPITLMEMGLYIDGPVMICCPPGYHRKGNVDIVARRHDVPVFESLEDLLKELKTTLTPSN
jgi:Nucleoside 2-deoxyribosyltransferase like